MHARSLSQCRSFSDAKNIYKAEDLSESVDKIDVALALCEKFKASFFQAKAKLSSLQPKRAWRFDPGLVFTRFDAFTARLDEIKSSLSTMIDFNRLEKVEIGGTKVGSVVIRCVHELTFTHRRAAFCRRRSC
jgi:dynein heavy chain